MDINNIFLIQHVWKNENFLFLYTRKAEDLIIAFLIFMSLVGNCSFQMST